MRVAALYDIHGNLPALEAAIRDVRQSGVDQIVVGGDVLLGPMPLETMRFLLELEKPVHFISGNCDREVLERMQGRETEDVPEPFREMLRWTARNLPPEFEGVLASWPLTHRLSHPSMGEILFCHATPQNDMSIFTSLTPEDRILPAFTRLDASVVVCGHTHMQFDRTIGGVRVVNAGSVGSPYGAPGAYWLLIGDDIEFRHTEYDLEEAAERIRRSAYPEAEDFAENNILRPHSEAEALEVFTAMSLKD